MSIPLRTFTPLDLGTENPLILKNIKVWCGNAVAFTTR